MENQKNSLQKFGGDWTEKKLNIFTNYLDAYLTALQNRKFKKVYIDAFAGTGEIETRDGEQCLIGSAKRALSADKKFDHYYFIEKDPEKAQKLREMIANEFSKLKQRTTVYDGDANEQLSKILQERDWRYNRGLLFLDPYATQVAWSTLENVAATKSIDVWYLFPFAALNRMLPRNGNYASWEHCIDQLLGATDWRTEFYKEDPQVSLFDLLPKDSEEHTTRKIKDANPEHLKAYIVNRLETIFPCVSRNPRIFRNSKHSPLFLFCFAISNDSGPAQGLALRIADHILKKK